MHYKAIIFDMDGTIVNTNPFQNTTHRPIASTTVTAVATSSSTSEGYRWCSNGLDQWPFIFRSSG